MDVSELAARYDEELRTSDYADIDASANGLQLGSGDREVERVAFAVDAAVETIEGAVSVDADALVTHHGLSWGGIERVTGRDFDRVEPLIREDVALYVSHLPLDGHAELGNAAGVADLLGLAGRERFGAMGPEYIGLAGTADALDPASVRETLETELDHGAGGVRHLDFGPREIEDVAVVTGSGADWFDDAVERGADAFITGEGKQKLYHQAKEAGVHVYLAGHYATETFGVNALADLATDWGVETTVLDAPTGI
ncbi:Nif3-like dinuclear metal center hexameric protein [Salarchaeum sp. III]|uniref:Nif3-like dinuclear metal center hexameric protein n=1 Tax=Salarchaeum sp. III TaxID=3107927 RepID=UPI002ED838C4